MTLTEIAEEVARRVGAPTDLAWGFLRETTNVVIEVLDKGGEVKIKGVGTLRWVPVKSTKVYDLREGHTQNLGRGFKLKLVVARQFRRRRTFDV